MTSVVAVVAIMILGACRSAPPAASVPQERSTEAATREPGHTQASPVVPRAELATLLDWIVLTFDSSYAPLAFKRDRFGFDIPRELAALRRDAPFTRPEVQRELMRVFRAPHDIHTSISFTGRERAVWLGVHFREVAGRVVVACLDRGALPESSFPFSLGDELVSFDGVPARDAIAAAGRATRWWSTPAFERSFAELMFAVRAESDWAEIPRADSPVTLELRRTGATESSTRVVVPWLDLDLVKPETRCRFWGKARTGFFSAAPVLDTPEPSDLIDGYVFALDGAPIGFLRVRSYGFGEEDTERALAQYLRLLEMFRGAGVRAVVWDQTGNGGGNFLFGYQLLSALLDAPIKPPLQHYLITPAGEIAGMGPVAELDALGRTFGAIETDEDAARLIEGNASFRRGIGFMERRVELTKELARWLAYFETLPVPTGAPELTPPHYVVLPQIARAPGSVRPLLVPLLMLADELNISAAEYVAAAARDGRRARVFGVNTAGAGGDQRAFTPERVCGVAEWDLTRPCVPRAVADAMRAVGIAAVYVTVTLGVRSDGSLIENAGVAPDVAYEITREDIVSGFVPYRRRVEDTLREMIGVPKP